MSFTHALISRLSRAFDEEQHHNRDINRYGKPPLLSRLYTVARSVAKAVGIGPYRWVHRINIRELDRWRDVLDDLDWLYARLDEESQIILVDVIAYRLMGFRAVKLPLNTTQYWERLKALESLRLPGKSVDFGYRDWQLERYDLKSLGYPIQLNTRAPGILIQFELQQYACRRLGVEVSPGDVVIDGGGCFGDTALFFAHLAGETGRVFSFEFIDSNLKLFRQNLELNHVIGSRVEICEHPMWSTSGDSLYVLEKGPASKVMVERPASGEFKQVQTLSIDDLCTRQNLPSVDFIKMDIEGAEFDALKGAEQTIRRYRPKLAVCVYHDPVDFIRLARLIHTFEPGYRFALGHFTIHAEETVLFARYEDTNEGTGD